MNKSKRLLVPIDFSEHSDAALRHACELAVGFAKSSEVHLVHIVPDAPDDPGLLEGFRAELERLGDAIEARTVSELETIKHVLPGDPATVITQYARGKDIDLVIMGTHGRTGFSHFALGSVAERVVRGSVCPVIVIGPHERDRSAIAALAVEEISSQLGNSFEATRDDGISQMRQLIQDKFDLHSVTSQRVVDRLLAAEWIEWKDGQPGKWSIVEGIEFVDEGKTAPIEPYEQADAITNLQAIDLIQRARQLRATDIHIDPRGAAEVVVRLRIDGRLEEYCRLDNQVGQHLINQFKTLGDLDIADPFHPQEGRLNLPTSLSDLEVRITSARVAAGDAIALRLFDGTNIFLPLANLGLSDAGLTSVEEMLRLGEGLVLVTGPTGSGKTTSVYSMLATLGSVDRNVVSIEDPVEFSVPFVRQMSVDHKHDVTMTSGLRTMLRMDPDIIFLGEIRGDEAAQIAMKAASSGKYVLSTLHTRDVASTVTALRDMTIGDRSIAGNLTGIINQRLLRRLCPNCKERKMVTDAQRESVERAGLPVPNEVFEPVGCETCRSTGYRGRVGVFEVALMNQPLKDAIADGASENQIKEILQSNGVKALLGDSLTTACDGVTSVDEALSVHWLS